jgi:hypothetical protein
VSFQKAYDSSHPLDDPAHAGPARTSAVHASLSRIHLSKSGTDLRQYLEETSKPPGCPGQVLLRSSESPSNRLAVASAPRREAPYRTPRIPMSTTLLPASHGKSRGASLHVRRHASRRPAIGPRLRRPGPATWAEASCDSAAVKVRGFAAHFPSSGCARSLSGSLVRLASRESRAPGRPRDWLSAASNVGDVD